MLQHRDSQYQIVGSWRAQIGDVCDVEVAAVVEALSFCPAPGLRDHRRTQVHAGDDGACCGKKTTPSSNTAAEVQGTSSGSNPHPRLQREALLELDRTVVEFRHAVRAHRRETVALSRKALRPLLPVETGPVELRSGNSPDAHLAIPASPAPSGMLMGSSGLS